MRLLLIPLLLAPVLAEDGVSRQNLERHVRTLASREFGGRKGKNGRLAEEYVAEAFRQAGLETRVREHDGFRIPCRNVVGVLRADKKPTPEHVIISAHYDHLGGEGLLFFPGAADNAAGVAALLEIVRLVKRPLKRDVLFIAFDQEECGLVGSFAYAKKPLRPLSECAAFLTFDILGRALADSADDTLFCVGAERSDGLFAVAKTTKLPDGLKLAFAGTDIVGQRSDYVAFEHRKVPFLFFSVGEFSDYHLTTDTPDRLDFDKLHREARLLLDVSRRVIAAPRPEFRAERARRIEEITGLREVVGQILAKPDKAGLSQADIVLGRIFEAQLRQIEQLGEVTKEQRAMVVRTCRELERRLR